MVPTRMPVRSLPHPVLARRQRQAVTVALAAGVLPLALAAADGGYFAPAWGWSALAFACLGVFALVAPDAARLERRELAYVASLAGVAVFVWSSLAWTAVVQQTVLEGLRALVLPLAVGVVLLVTRAAALPLLVGSVVTAATATAVYALGTRLVPDRLGEFDAVGIYRLAAPLGYWNALGIFMAVGAALALGVAARGRGRTGRALAAAALLALLPAMYFTFGRGAWIALGLGLLVAVALDPRRLQLLATVAALTPAPAAALLLASRSGALTHQRSQLAEAAREGHRFALVLVLLAVAQAVVALLLARLEPRVSPSARVRRGLNGLVLGAAVAAAAAGVAWGGGPVEVVRSAQDAFAAPPPSVKGDLNQRLFSFSGNGRATLWQAAWDEYAANPLLGSGAGTYERHWLRHRPDALKVRDAHSLYVETLAELGPLGLALLVGALAVPLTALGRARRHPLGPFLAAAYVGFLAHAGVDWDWEVLAVTLTGLVCGAGILVAARAGERRPLSTAGRGGAVAAVLAATAVAFVGLVGSAALASAADAARAGDWASSEAHARRARTWAPWSAEPWRRIGEARLATGRVDEARAAFRAAIEKNRSDWSLWLDLARASSGRAQQQALGRAKELNPLSPEIARLEQELDAAAGLSVSPG